MHARVFSDLLIHRHLLQPATSLVRVLSHPLTVDSHTLTYTSWPPQQLGYLLYPRPPFPVWALCCMIDRLQPVSQLASMC